MKIRRIFPDYILFSLKCPVNLRKQVETIPVQDWTGNEGGRSSRLPHFKTVKIWGWQGRQPYAQAVFTHPTPREYSYHCWLEHELIIWLKCKLYGVRLNTVFYYCSHIALVLKINILNILLTKIYKVLRVTSFPILLYIQLTWPSYIVIYRLSQELRTILRDLIPELMLSQKRHKHTGPIRNHSGVMSF